VQDVPYGMLGTTLIRGSSGPAVTHLQEGLRTLGYFKDIADGVFRMSTEQAVKTFQIKTGQAADGIVGPATLGNLAKALADQAAGGRPP
jgi:peptidoglycan hydrolase-like protein with peptidoglycan-binding domain